MKEYQISTYIFDEEISIKVKAEDIKKAVKQFENMSILDLLKTVKVKDLHLGHSDSLIRKKA